MPSTYYLYPLSCFRRDLVFCPHTLFQNCSPDFFSFILFQDWFPVFLILVYQCWFQDFSLHAVFRTGLRILPLIFSFKTDTSCSLSYIVSGLVSRCWSLYIVSGLISWLFPLSIVLGLTSFFRNIFFQSQFQDELLYIA